MAIRPLFMTNGPASPRAANHNFAEWLAQPPGHIALLQRIGRIRRDRGRIAKRDRRERVRDRPECLYVARALSCSTPII